MKGVKGTKQEFLITAGEVRAASVDPNWELAIVTRALSNEPKIEFIPASDYLQRFATEPVVLRSRPN